MVLNFISGSFTSLTGFESCFDSSSGIVHLCLSGPSGGLPEGNIQIGTSADSGPVVFLFDFVAFQHFLTSPSINNARACRILNPLSIHPRALSLLIHIQRDISISATVYLENLSKCLAERESLSAERAARRTLRGRPRSLTARRLVCRSVCLGLWDFWLAVGRASRHRRCTCDAR